MSYICWALPQTQNFRHKKRHLAKYNSHYKTYLTQITGKTFHSIKFQEYLVKLRPDWNFEIWNFLNCLQFELLIETVVLDNAILFTISVV